MLYLLNRPFLLFIFHLFSNYFGTKSLLKKEKERFGLHKSSEKIRTFYPYSITKGQFYFNVFQHLFNKVHTNGFH